MVKAAIYMTTTIIEVYSTTQQGRTRTQGGEGPDLAHSEDRFEGNTWLTHGLEGRGVW